MSILSLLDTLVDYANRGDRSGMDQLPDRLDNLMILGCDLDTIILYFRDRATKPGLADEMYFCMEKKLLGRQ
jgi:hypothetical protein